MMVQKHTPSPWGIDADGITAGDHINGFQPFGACGCCNSPWMRGETEHAQADANLICAAPELLEACQALIDYCDKNPPMGESLWSVQQIRAAVAKATGATSAPDNAVVSGQPPTKETE